MSSSSPLSCVDVLCKHATYLTAELFFFLPYYLIKVLTIVEGEELEERKCYWTSEL